MSKKYRELTLEEFRAEVKAQGVEKNDFAFICPSCGTVQSAKMLIAAGAGKDFDEVESILGFSCVGRFSGDKGEGVKGCDWTLGGFLQIHELSVLVDSKAAMGVKKCPHFEIATPEQAKALRDQLAGGKAE